MLIAGQALAGLALVFVGLGPTAADYTRHLLLPMALLGLGGGLAFPAMTMVAMADVDPRDAGLASGLLNTTGQVGGALGLAVMATIAGSRSMAAVNGGLDGVAALAVGYHFAWLVGAAIIVVTIAVSVWMLRPGRSVQTVAMPDDCCEAAA
jgi:hypothetical protein